MASPNTDQIILNKANSQALVLKGLSLKDPVTGGTTIQNAATVLATLYDSEGVAVDGLTDLTLDYVVASQGIYTGAIGADFDPAPGIYSLRIVAAQGPNENRFTKRVIIEDR